MSTLLDELKQLTGSEAFYRHPLFRKYIYTEGVKYLTEKTGVFWLIEYVFSNQLDETIKDHDFQVWALTVKDDDSAVIRVEDGNDNLIRQSKLEGL
ncbi:MAG: hypothetical protein H6573_35400 [Lewinellaceae bacterium]|nr:hypothetical protein [Lewinellaceae bacterium]